MKLIFLGAPGSGKGTQGEKLAERHGFQVITASDLLRRYAQSDTSIGGEVKKLMDAGSLVDAALVWQVMSQEIARLTAAKKNIILDGFPRSLSQLELLNSDSHDYDCLIYFDISPEVVIKRVSGRRVHVPSGRVYNIDYAPPKVAGKDDVTGEPLVHRKDDQPDVVKKRIETYKQSTLPILDVVKKQIKEGTGRIKRIAVVNADQSIERVMVDIEQLLHL